MDVEIRLTETANRALRARAREARVSLDEMASRVIEESLAQRPPANGDVESPPITTRGTSPRAGGDLPGFLTSRRSEILAICEKHGARNVRVFGSCARGDARPNSDVDFLIDLGERRSAWFPVGLVQDLEDLLARDVDVVTSGALHSSIRDRVLAEAVAL